MPSALPGWARVTHLFTPFASILLVGLVVVGSPPSTAAWEGLGCWGGTQALGVGGGCFAILFGGGLGRTPVATVASTTAWLAIWHSGSLPGSKPKAHLFVDVQCQRGDEGLFQAFSTAVAGIVVCNYYVVQV